MKENFTKSELKTGMIVVNNLGNMGTVYLDTPEGSFILWEYNREKLRYKASTRSLETLNENLEFSYKNGTKGSIVEVLIPNRKQIYSSALEGHLGDCKTIWKKGAVKEVTITELLGHYGCSQLVVRDGMNNSVFNICEN